MADKKISNQLNDKSQGRGISVESENEENNNAKKMAEIHKELRIFTAKACSDINSQIEILTKKIDAFNDLSSKLSNLPQQLSGYLKQNIPELSQDVNKAILGKLDKASRNCYDNLETVDVRINSVLDNFNNKLGTIISQINRVDTNKIRRYFIAGLCFTLISTVTSAATAYYFMKKHPQYIEIKTKGEVIIEGSDVYFLGSNTPKINNKRK
jgi:hypothetical protein